MRIVEREEEEERPRPLLLDEADGAAGEVVGHVLVFPQRGLAPLHVADAADAVDDRLIVAVARRHPELLGMALAGRAVVYRRRVTDRDRICRIEPDHAAVFDVNGGHAIAGRSHDERIVEADVVRRRRDFAVPVRPACGPETEVPLADDACRVACAPQQRGQRGPTGLDDQRRIARQDTGARLAERILAGQQRVARRCAGRRRGMRIGETQSGLRQAVDVRGADGLGAVRGNVAVSQVIGVNDDDVWTRLRGCGSGQQEEQGRSNPQALEHKRESFTVAA